MIQGLGHNNPSHRFFSMGGGGGAGRGGGRGGAGRGAGRGGAGRAGRGRGGAAGLLASVDCLINLKGKP